MYGTRSTSITTHNRHNAVVEALESAPAITNVHIDIISNNAKVTVTIR